MKKVSIILLTYNDERDADNCLKSLTRLNYPAFQVIVVNNGSTEESRKRLKKFVKEAKKTIPVKLINLKKNLGFAGGNNVGVRAANTHLVVLLNSDTCVNKNYLREMVKTFESNSNVGCVGSKVINIGRYSGRIDTVNTLNIFGLAVRDLDQTDSFGPSGCSILFDKRVVGLPFDEDYFIYGEDVYLSWFMNLKGYKNQISTKAVVRHKSIYSDKMNFIKCFHMHKNGVMNFLIFFEFINIVKILPIWIVVQSGLLFVSVFNGKLSTWIKSYAWIVKNFGKIMQKRKYIQKVRRVRDADIRSVFSCRISYKLGLATSFVNLVLYLYCFALRIPVQETLK